jgi:predicted NUDIX family phosphoesterase
MTVKYPEHIYAVQTSGLVKALNISEDFTPAIGHAEFFDAIQPFVVMAQRNMLEQNPDYRQFLPYMLISRMSAGVKEYLVYLRAKGTGEERLFGNASIGVGGHVDSNDTILDASNVLRFDQVIEMAHTRELFEELCYGQRGTDVSTYTSMDVMSPTDGIRLSSYINNNTSVHGYIVETPAIGEDGKIPVGLVHMAYVMEISLGDVIDATCNESAMELIGWMTSDQLAISTLTFENWSKIIIEQLPAMEAAVLASKTRAPLDFTNCDVVEVV